MAGILRPDRNRRGNLSEYLKAVSDSELRTLLLKHLDDILAVGGASSNKDAEAARGRFMDSVQCVIQRRVEVCHEDTGD